MRGSYGIWQKKEQDGWVKGEGVKMRTALWTIFSWVRGVFTKGGVANNTIAIQATS